MAEKLVGLAKQSYSAISKTSPIIEEVKYNAQELIRLTNRREQVLEQLIELAKPLPEYEILLSIPGIAETTATSVIGELGDIRRFTSANQINAFIGIDLKHYESGDFLGQEHITKRGNPYARKFCTNVFTISLQLAILILAISQISMRNKKTIADNFN